MPLPGWVADIEMFSTNSNFDEVLLGPGRGPVGQKKIRLSRKLWTQICKLDPSYELLVRDTDSLAVYEAARFASALKQHRPQVRGWPKLEREQFETVLSMLYRNDGLEITRVNSQQHTVPQAAEVPPFEEVRLRPRFGPAGQRGLRISRALWEKICQIAIDDEEKSLGLFNDWAILKKAEADKIATRLTDGQQVTKKWSDEDRDTFQAVVRMLQQTDGIEISRPRGGYEV